MTKPDSVSGTPRAPFLVYLQLVSVLHRQLERLPPQQGNRPNLVDACTAEAARWGMDSNDCRLLRGYLLEPTSGFKIMFSVSEKELRDSLQKLYEMLCHDIGPVATDRMLAVALDKVSRSKAATVFPPRRLL